MKTTRDKIVSTDKEPFVSLRPVLKRHCHYNLLLGERSNGKTFCVLEYIIERKAKYDEQAVYMRRWDLDVKPINTVDLFNGVNNCGLVKKYTRGRWDSVGYYNGKWYFQRTYTEVNTNGQEIEKVERDKSPLMISYTITGTEHRKGPDFSVKVRTIFFDEFISTKGYLNDEFILFMQSISTIVRLRDDITIFMCGNTINPYSPYFREMGLKAVQKMQRGDIDVIEYGESGLRVCVYMTDSVPKKIKKSNVYFAFNNPRLSMITGNGAIWDLTIYPHCPTTYEPKHVKFNFFIDFEEHLLHGELIKKDNMLFIFIHEKTTPLKHPKKDLVYTLDDLPDWNVRKSPNRPVSKVEKIIATLFQQKKVFYQDNEVGNIVENYLKECRSIL